MKLIKPILAILLLLTVTACSKKESPPEPAAQKASTETVSINAAKKVLDDSKQVNQTIQNSEAAQKESIEKAQQ